MVLVARKIDKKGLEKKLKFAYRRKRYAKQTKDLLKRKVRREKETNRTQNIQIVSLSVS